jgi:hypothetical protein
MKTRLLGFLILAAIGLTISECSSADRNDSGDIVSSGDVQASDIRFGDCFNDLPAVGDSFSSVKAVPCTEAHQWQLFHRGTLALTSFSEVEVREAASAICNEAANTLFNQMSAIKYDAFKNAELGFFVIIILLDSFVIVFLFSFFVIIVLLGSFVISLQLFSSSP